MVLEVKGTNAVIHEQNHRRMTRFGRCGQGQTNFRDRDSRACPTNTRHRATVLGSVYTFILLWPTTFEIRSKQPKYTWALERPLNR